MSTNQPYPLKRKCHSVYPLSSVVSDPSPIKCSISNLNLVTHSCMKSFGSFEKKSVHGEILKKMKLEKSEKTFSSEKITINKDSLKNILILGQVNFSAFSLFNLQIWKKIIVTVDTVSWTILVIDQHAIHERIRYEYYESLLKSLVLSTGETEKRYLKFDQSMIKLKNTENVLMKKVQLCPQRQILVPLQKIDDVKLANYCIDYDVISKEGENQLKLNIRSVPCILGEQIELDSILDILQFDNDSKNLPRKIDELLMSKACKNAIKFNDELDNTRLEKLVSQLLHCEHPLYCVHGRNSIFPVCNLKKLINRALKIKRPRRKFSFKNFI